MTLADVPREGESIYGSRAKPDYVIDPETGCWVWQKATLRGYATYGDGKKPHRVYYERAHGPIPDGHHIHHTCQNRACVNPAHLEALPAKEHIAHHMAERWGLSLETVKEIRRLGEQRASAEDVAARFGLDPRTVKRYWSGEHWPELGGRVELEMKTCLECGDEFNHGRRHKVYCSRLCQGRAKQRRREQRQRELRSATRERSD